MDFVAASFVVDIERCNFCLFTSMERILGPNCTLLYLHSNNMNNLFLKKKFWGGGGGGGGAHRYNKPPNKPSFSRVKEKISLAEKKFGKGHVSSTSGYNKNVC